MDGVRSRSLPTGCGRGRRRRRRARAKAITAATMRRTAPRARTHGCRPSDDHREDEDTSFANQLPSITTRRTRGCRAAGQPAGDEQAGGREPEEDEGERRRRRGRRRGRRPPASEQADEPGHDADREGDGDRRRARGRAAARCGWCRRGPVTRACAPYGVASAARSSGSSTAISVGSWTDRLRSAPRTRGACGGLSGRERREPRRPRRPPPMKLHAHRPVGHEEQQRPDRDDGGPRVEDQRRVEAACAPCRAGGGAGASGRR